MAHHQSRCLKDIIMGQHEPTPPWLALDATSGLWTLTRGSDMDIDRPDSGTRGGDSVVTASL